MKDSIFPLITRRNLIQIWLLCAAMLPAMVHAQFTFTTNNDGSLNLYRYTGTNAVVIIPDTTNGLSVTSIGVNAFFTRSIISVTIPNSVTSVGAAAFEYCFSLTNLIIGTNVTSVGKDAFFDCSSLISVMIPNSVTNVGIDAFNCPKLTAITVDTNNSFYSSIDGVLFNQSQTTLIQCPGAKAGSYTIPNSVTNIGSDAFFYCNNLSAITVNTNDAFFSSMDGVLFNQSQTTLIQCPGGKAGSYTIPNSVTSIGNGAFSACSRLTSVAIPNSVVTVGSDAFFNCNNLTNLIIGTNVTSIGEDAFGDCNRLTSVAIPNSVTTIGNYAFYSCYSLNSITIPNSVTTIGNYAFFGCSSLNKVTIPNSVTSMGNFVFYDCTSLMGVYFLGNAPAIGAYNFLDDGNVTVYYLPGTTGWGTIVVGCPTVLWFLPNPLILADSPSFGVQSNGFGFIISWATNIPVVVEACTNLFNPVWQPVQTNTLTGGTAYFSDPQWTNYPGRYYRLRSP